jgi:acyl carrier protein
MMPDEIKEILIQVLLEIQGKSGRSVPAEIHDGTRPVGDFEGFDSLNAIEATSILTEYLDYIFPPDLLLGPTPQSQFTLEEMVSRIQLAIRAQGGLP